MLARGYVVVATDYPGLGAPGMHPYLIDEGHSRALLPELRSAVSSYQRVERSGIGGMQAHTAMRGGTAEIFDLVRYRLSAKACSEMAVFLITFSHF
jgi:hypothetical protein